MSEPTALSTKDESRDLPVFRLPLTPGMGIMAGVSLSSYRALSFSTEL